MKRTALLLAVMAATLVVASGVALAANYIGTNKGERIVGTGFADTVDARGGNDTVYGLGGNDSIRGGLGSDRQYGGPGDDTIRTQGGFRDFVDCGAGIDTAFVDRQDRAVNCERLI